jgi:endo-1,4-beta-D-glucanase Y
MTGGTGGRPATGGTTGGLGGTTGAGGTTGVGGAGGSTRTCPVTDTNIISDFEEGFGVLVKQGGRTGFWYTYADVCPTPPANSYTCVGTAASSQTPPPAPAAQADHLAVEASGSTDACNKWAFHSTAANHTAFVGVGAAFSPPAPPSTSMIKSAYSVAAYDGISFTMKSGGGTQPPILFEMLTTENQPNTQGGSIDPASGTPNAHMVTDLYNTRAVLFNAGADPHGQAGAPGSIGWQPALSTTFQTYYIPFGMLMPRWMPAPGTAKACPPFAAGDPKCQAPGWVPADTLGFQLSVLSDIPGSAGAYNIWIDDVKFYTRPAGGIPGELPAPPTTAGAAHPFPQNAAMIGACPKPAGPSVDGKFLVSAYNQWRARFTRAEGGGIRVVRPAAETGTGEDSVSEGIAYGMLIAVYMNDKAFFDGLWAYWRLHCDNSTPVPTACLMTWRVGGAGGTGTATDADEDAAFAMLMASRQWGAATIPTGDNTSYGTNATNLRNAVLGIDMSTSSPFILGGSHYTAGSATNASYFAPAWYRVFAAADLAGNPTNAGRWTTLATNAYTLIGNATAAGAFASTGLISAWCGTNCTGTATNGGSANPGTDVLYQYDSHRIPFRIGLDFCWNGTAAASTYLGKVSSFFAGKAANGVGRVLDIFTPAGGDVGVGTAPTAPNSSSVLGTSAVGALGITADAAYVRDAYQAVFDQTTRASLNDPATGLTPYSYFNATVGLMTLLVMTGNFTAF